MEHHYMWSWPVIGYLFVAGFGAGAMAISALVCMQGEEGTFGKRYFNIARYGAWIAPLPLIGGTGLLIFELGRPFRAFNIMASNFWYEVINPSPMNFGGWFLLIVGGISVVYAATFVRWKSLLPGALGEKADELMDSLRMPLAGISVPLAIATAIYTAILLGAIPSRPLWNSPVLWALFTVSAFSTGTAAIMLVNRLSYRSNGDREADKLFHNSGYWLSLSDVMLIIMELIVIGLFIMMMYFSVQNARFAVQVLLPGGEMASVFWIGVVLIGLVIPLVVEAFYVARKALGGGEFHVPYVVELAAPAAVLFGGLALRYAIVIGGQITGPIGV